MTQNELAALIEKHITETERLNALIEEFNKGLPKEEEIPIALTPMQNHDFALWREKGIRSERLGLTIAPVDYCEYAKNGKRKKTHFTYVEAMEIEEKILRPNGWRLLASQEWFAICQEFSVKENEPKDIAHFLDKLNLNPDADTKAEQLFDTIVIGPAKKAGKVSAYWTPHQKDSISAKAIIIPGQKVLNYIGKTGHHNSWGRIRVHYSRLKSKVASIRCVSIK